jgi:hypothetical protein
MTPGEGQRGTSLHPGRPSVVAPFAPQITGWLRENPDIAGVEILRRVRLAGYRGGKSALYELVRLLRTSQGKTSPSSSEADERIVRPAQE